MSEHLLLERRPPAAILTLNRPDKHNALNGALLEAIDERLAELDADADIRGIVLTGGARTFSTGADLNEALAVDSLPGTIRFLERFRRANARLELSQMNPPPAKKATITSTINHPASGVAPTAAGATVILAMKTSVPSSSVSTSM